MKVWPTYLPNLLTGVGITWSQNDFIRSIVGEPFSYFCWLFPHLFSLGLVCFCPPLNFSFPSHSFYMFLNILNIQLGFQSIFIWRRWKLLSSLYWLIQNFISQSLLKSLITAPATLLQCFIEFAQNKLAQWKNYKILVSRFTSPSLGNNSSSFGGISHHSACSQEKSPRAGGL